MRNIGNNKIWLEYDNPISKISRHVRFISTSLTVVRLVLRSFKKFFLLHAKFSRL